MVGGGGDNKQRDENRNRLNRDKQNEIYKGNSKSEDFELTISKEQKRSGKLDKQKSK